MKKKILLYKANFGFYDYVNNSDYIDKNYKDIFITDIKSKNKKNIYLFSNLQARNYLKKIGLNFFGKLTNQDLNRIVKIYPFELFPDYDIYIYLDSNLIITSSLNSLVNNKADWISVPHRFSQNLTEELKACYINNKINFDEFLNFYLTKKNLSQFSKFTENGFMIRKSNSKVRRVSKLWLKKYLNGPRRDQLHLTNIKEIKKLNIFYTTWKFNSPLSPLKKNPHISSNYEKFKNRFIKIYRILIIFKFFFSEIKVIKKINKVMGKSRCRSIGFLIM